jgi:hypothetical protein
MADRDVRVGLVLGTNTIRRSTDSFSAGPAPRNLMLPADGNSWPASIRSSVVLPAPFRPSRPVIEPASTSKVTSSSAN